MTRALTRQRQVGHSIAGRAHISCQTPAQARLLLLEYGQHRLTVTGEHPPRRRSGTCTKGERLFSIHAEPKHRRSFLIR